MKLHLLVVITLIPFITFAGGPWTTKNKSGFFQLQSTFPVGAYSDLFLENNENLALKRSVLDYTFQAYIEYGLSDKLNLITTLPYKYISTGDTIENSSTSELLPKGKLSGLSNYQLALKYSLLNKKLKAAISVKSSFNTVNKDIEKGLITGYQTNTVGLFGHIGKSFSKGKMYSFIEGGVYITSNNFSDYYEIHYELGYQIKPFFWTVLTLDLKESLNNGSYHNENLKQTGFYTNNQEYFAYGIKASYELNNKIGFTIAGFGAFSGNYVAKISTFSLGVYKKL